ncbi:hypothetical protein GCM10007169_09440 [Shewanella fodinae]|nr:hypothetical protein GCM10007169_09440 [Shewanella fodinae]
MTSTALSVSIFRYLTVRPSAILMLNGGSVPQKQIKKQGKVNFREHILADDISLA